MKNFANHLLKELKTHLLQYLILITVGVFFLLMLNLFAENKIQQFFVLTLFISFYIVWGIIHHLIEKTLYLKIVIEYILIGAVFLFLLQILLIH